MEMCWERSPSLCNVSLLSVCEQLAWGIAEFQTRRGIEDGALIVTLCALWTGRGVPWGSPCDAWFSDTCQAI